MKTAINGKIRLKLFRGGLYSGGGMTPIETLYKLGRWRLAKVVYAKYAPCTPNYYRADVLELLQKYYDVKWKKTPNDSDSMWHSAYSKIDGGYVGRPEDAYRYFQQGIRDIQKSDTAHKVCSIGFLPEKQRWVGWSHRAMCSFGVGDIVKKGDCCASSGWTEEYLKTHDDPYVLPVGFEAKTLQDARRMAIAFAESVS